MGTEATRRLIDRLGVGLSEEDARLALTHASVASELPEAPSNERLEFLGDAVLDLAVAELLYHAYPERPEGELSKLRGVIVSRPTLAKKARELDLGDCLLLGKGEERSGGRTRPSILGAALEAVFGIVFLRLGYQVALELARSLFEKEIGRAGVAQSEDYKSMLQELGHRNYGAAPEYLTVESAGPEHKKVFTVEAVLAGRRVLGRGRSKKEAEQTAAKRLFLALSEEDERDGGPKAEHPD